MKIIFLIIFIFNSILNAEYICSEKELKYYTEQSKKFYNAYKSLYSKNEKENFFANLNLQQSELMLLMSIDCEFHLENKKYRNIYVNKN